MPSLHSFLKRQNLIIRVFCRNTHTVRWFNFTREREDRRTFKPLKPNSTCIGLQTGRVVPAH